MSTDNLRVTLLGTCPPPPLIERFGISTLIEAGDQKILVDCGRGAAQRLNQVGVPFGSADKLFLTHLHSDHVVGLPDLYLTGWIYGRRTPLRIWGPSGTREMMSHLEKAFNFDIHMRRDVDEKLSADGIRFVATEIEEGLVYDEAGLKITAFDVDHRPVKPSFGFRLDFAGRTVVFSGDTRPCENLVRHAQGADLIIHEVFASDEFVARTRGVLTPEQQQRVIDHHTTPEQAGEVFARTMPRLAVYSHMSATGEAVQEIIEGTRSAYSGPFEVGHDLMTIEVSDEVRVISK